MAVLDYGRFATAPVVNARPSTAEVLGIPSRALARIPTLGPLLAPARLVVGAPACRRAPLTALLAWGRKPSGKTAAAIARERGLPVLRCEDGFLRSLGLGPDGPPWSLLIDDLGIYYDAHAPSRLEALISQSLSRRGGPAGRCPSGALAGRTGEQVQRRPRDPPPSEPFVLVVDQTMGDLSLRYGMAEGASFQRMIRAALDNHPHCSVLLKIHPDVAAGRKRGYLAEAPLSHPRLRICADGGHPTALLERAEAVYVVCSQLGFEALLWGRPVHCFGMPFYAGWGLTRDALPPPPRRQPHRPTIDQLVHAALVAYPRYIDPHRGQPCGPETLIRAIGLQRRRQQELPAAVEAFGFKPWKQPILRRFLRGSQLRFRRRNAVSDGASSALAIWGRDPGRGVARRLLQQPDPTLLRIEDGFLRSVGLGANLIAPISWVVDRSGIYYDAGAPSDLETMLRTHPFADAERSRGGALRQQLVAAALTKYNLQAPPWRRPAGVRRVVLVPGQVESDASIFYGAPDLNTNLALLQAVRAAEPEAWIVYKPHPDVVAGLRGEGSPQADLQHWCDALLTEGCMDQLLKEVDAVHVLTSLAGFEALLRGVEVHTWGLPFFAGWGLSHDRLTCPRRGRQLQLDELVYAALVAYPRYVSRRSGLFIEPEQAIEELLGWSKEPPQAPNWWRGIFRHWGRWRERIAPHTFRSPRL